MGNSKKIALGIGIAIILALFTGFLSWQVSSDGEKVCQNAEKVNAVCCDGNTQIVGPKTSGYYYWTATSAECSSTAGSTAAVVDKSNCKDSTYISEKCSDGFKKSFGATAIITGLIALGFGIAMKKNLTIEGGLIGGAIINFVMGLVSYWDWLEGWLRVVLAGLILAGLIVLAWYKLKD